MENLLIFDPLDHKNIRFPHTRLMAANSSFPLPYDEHSSFLQNYAKKAAY